MRRFPILLTVLVLAVPAEANAADTTITFDTKAAGTVLGPSTYAGPGTTSAAFRVSPTMSSGAGRQATITAAPAGVAHTGANIAETDSCHVEICPADDLWIHFPYAKRTISLWAGASTVNALTMRLYDGGGGLIGKQTLAVGSGALTQFQFQSGIQNVSFVSIANADGHGTIRIDDLTFDNPAVPPPPNFALVRDIDGLSGTDVGLGMVADSDTSFKVHVTRINGSTGNLVFAVNGLSAGVTASLVPSSPTSADTITVTLHATAGAASVDDHQLTVSATAAPGVTTAGAATNGVLVYLTVYGRHDIQITGIEVTQGIQDEVVRCTSTSECAENVSLPRRDATHPSNAIGYQGVTLVRGKRMVARVFANVRLPKTETVPDVTVELHAYNTSGKELAGSPLIGGNRDLIHGGGGWDKQGSGLDWVTFKDRVDLRNSWNLTIPDSWTQRSSLTLRATIIPKVQFVGTGTEECNDALCGVNNSFKLTGIPFVNTGHFSVATARLWLTGEDKFAPEPIDALSLVDLWFPLADGAVQYEPYSHFATINIDDIAADNPGWNLSGDANKDARDDFRSEVRSALDDYADDYPGCAWADFCADAIQGYFAGVGVSSGHLPGGQPVSVVNAGRPGEAAHEMGHGIGRVHADLLCGGNDDGQTGETWPPDDKGKIAGIGYDTRPGKAAVIAPYSLGAADPFPSVSGQYADYYDYMSYCPNEVNKWASVLGQAKNIALLQDIKSELNRARTGSLHAGSTQNVRVQAIVKPGGATRIVGVKPSTGAQAIGAVDSPFRVRLKNVSGGVITEQPMVVSVGQEGPDLFLSAEIAAAGVASVEVLNSSVVGATSTRSAHAPAVRLKGPKTGARIGTGTTVAVVWTATDADGGHLRARLDYSIDDGKLWRPIYQGPNTGAIALPSTYFGASKKARIRVRVSDGFNETTATSGRLTAVGRKPAVAISDPKGGSSLPADATINAIGSATDDIGRSLKGRALTWFLGRKRVGRGATLSLAGLPSGSQTLRLIARDRAGRTGETKVRLRITAVEPAFIVVTAAALSHSAKKLRLLLSATVPSRLKIGKQTFVVGRRARTIVVKVKPGAEPLTLRLTLTAGAEQIVRTLVVSRT